MDLSFKQDADSAALDTSPDLSYKHHDESVGSNTAFSPGQELETDSAADVTDSVCMTKRHVATRRMKMNTTTGWGRNYSDVEPRQKTVTVTRLVFGRNKYVLATLLSPVLKSTLCKVLAETTRWDEMFPESVRASIFLSLTEKNQSALSTAKQVMDEVERAECWSLFITELLERGEMSTFLKDKVLEICRNKYLPPVPRFMILLFRNRDEKDQEKLMNILKIKPALYDDDTDEDDEADDEAEDDDKNKYIFVGARCLYDDIALERALSRWILRKQRSREYNGFCDSKGNDLNALATVEQAIVGTAKMPLLRVDPNVVKTIHDTWSEKTISLLFTKIKSDLGLIRDDVGFELNEGSLRSPSCQKRQSSLIADWFLALQRRGLISQPLGNGIICFSQLKEQMEALHSFECGPNKVEKYSNDLDARIRSFGVEWDRRHTQSAVAMALGGFHLLSLNHAEDPFHDRVMCSQCGVHVFAWENSDDPDMEHLWHGCTLSCPFLSKKHGSGLVRFIEGLHKNGGGKPQDLTQARNMYNARYY